MILCSGDIAGDLCIQTNPPIGDFSWESLVDIARYPNAGPGPSDLDLLVKTIHPYEIH